MAEAEVQMNPLHYASLASGSKGNCHALSDGGRTLLVDAGLSFLQLRKRLDQVGMDLSTVQAVALTHEHADHIAALPLILKRTPWTILTTADTRAALDFEIPMSRWIPVEPGRSLDWGGWRIHPFAIPHDAADPVAYRLEVGSRSMVIATDLGHPTSLVAEHCRDLDLLVLESNHDVDMLRNGEYPPFLKARILSRVGHLSNEAMAQLLASVTGPRLQDVVLAHLSESNNLPDLARFAAEEVLRDSGVRTHVALQREPIRLPVAG